MTLKRSRARCLSLINYGCVHWPLPRNQHHPRAHIQSLDSDRQTPLNQSRTTRCNHSRSVLRHSELPRRYLWTWREEWELGGRLWFGTCSYIVASLELWRSALRPRKVTWSGPVGWDRSSRLQRAMKPCEPRLTLTYHPEQIVSCE